MKSTESDVCYFEVDAVFNREPVELLEESTWTAGFYFYLNVFYISGMGACGYMTQVVITPTAMCPKSTEWYTMQISKGCPDKNLKIKIAIRIDRPQNMKHAGSVAC